MDKFGVSQKAVIVNQDNKVLVLLRGSGAPYNPLKWDLPGGDIEFGEDPYKSIEREVLEETGRHEKLKPFDVEAHVNADNYHWVTVAYLARTLSTDVKISYEHDEYKWVTLDEFRELDCPPKIVRFVENYYTT